MKKLITILSILSLGSATVLAQAPVWNEIKGELKTALEIKGDPIRGKVAFEQCQGCHRADASGRVSGAYPRLSGQHAQVLMKQIADIRSGRRNNPKMEPFIGDHVLTPFDIADVSIYLEGLPMLGSNGKGTGSALDKGKQLYDKDCAVCHGAKGEGDAVKFYPMVAAQHYKYLLREVNFIRDGDRRNSNPDMVTVIKPYLSTDLDAVADYMSQFAPPKK
ncbi:MAG: c-type cytochrome [Rhodoferax sp.]|uniref:c-type cytochrome n=1 Tax=Rhodoferax sp. TaxID=50421 RepID=UPI00301A2338